MAKKYGKYVITMGKDGIDNLYIIKKSIALEVRQSDFNIIDETSWESGICPVCFSDDLADGDCGMACSCGATETMDCEELLDVWMGLPDEDFPYTPRKEN